MIQTSEKRRIEIRPYTLKELAGLYKVCTRTLKKWIQPFRQEIGEQNGRYFSIPQVRIIFDKLSLPSYVDMD